MIFHVPAPTTLPFAKGLPSQTPSAMIAALTVGGTVTVKTIFPSVLSQPDSIVPRTVSKVALTKESVSGYLGSIAILSQPTASSCTAIPAR